MHALQAGLCFPLSCPGRLRLQQLNPQVKKTAPHGEQQIPAGEFITVMHPQLRQSVMSIAEGTATLPMVCKAGADLLQCRRGGGMLLLRGLK